MPPNANTCHPFLAAGIGAILGIAIILAVDSALPSARELDEREIDRDLARRRQQLHGKTQSEIEEDLRKLRAARARAVQMETRANPGRGRTIGSRAVRTVSGY